MLLTSSHDDQERLDEAWTELAACESVLQVTARVLSHVLPLVVPCVVPCPSCSLRVRRRDRCSPLQHPQVLEMMEALRRSLVA